LQGQFVAAAFGALDQAMVRDSRANTSCNAATNRPGYNIVLTALGRSQPLTRKERRDHSIYNNLVICEAANGTGKARDREKRDQQNGRDRVQARWRDRCLVFRL
jgi:hypothetical protein